MKDRQALWKRVNSSLTSQLRRDLHVPQKEAVGGAALHHGKWQVEGLEKNPGRLLKLIVVQN